MSQQISLFGASLRPSAPQAVVGLVPPSAEVQACARRLPARLRLGTSSWSFAGWKGILWDQETTEAALARGGLPTYSQHPLLRTVGLDRAHYKPISSREYQELAAQVPADFRFLVKAHEDCTLARIPPHPRYGARANTVNNRYLDPVYATEAVVGPWMEGLGAKAGVLLFQFAPQAIADMGGAQFPERLFDFLRQLPVGPQYAVELRNSQLLVPEVADVLVQTRTTPCLSGWTGLPTLSEQARRLRASVAPLRVIRWLLPIGRSYEEMRASYEPYNALLGPDPDTRQEIVELSDTDKETYVIINNKAEGCSPLSVMALAKALARF